MNEELNEMRLSFAAAGGIVGEDGVPRIDGHPVVYTDTRVQLADGAWAAAKGWVRVEQ